MFIALFFPFLLGISSIIAEDIVMPTTYIYVYVGKDQQKKGHEDGNAKSGNGDAGVSSVIGGGGVGGSNSDYRWYQVDYNRDVISKEDIRARILNTLPYVKSSISASSSPTITQEYVTALGEGTTYLKAQVQRRNEIAVQIKGMDQVEKRTEILGLATDSLKASKAYYLEDKFEDGRIAGQIADVFLDLATSLTPGISWVRDVYEAISGKDLHSGEILDSFSHATAALGAVTVGYGSKAIKALGVFEKLAKVTIEPLRPLLYSKPLTELKETLSFFKRHSFWKQTDHAFLDFTNAFMRESKVYKLEADTVVYRHYIPGKNEPRGNWVSRNKLENPQNDLSLPLQGQYSAHQWVIPKGTEVMEGIVASKFGKAGGGNQIFIPNKEILQ